MRRCDYPGSPNGLTFGTQPGWKRTWSGVLLTAILAALIGAPWWIGLYTIMKWASTWKG